MSSPPERPPRPPAWCLEVAAGLDPAGVLRRHGARIAASARVGLRPQIRGVAAAPARLIVEDAAVIEPDCVLDLSGTVRIGARARVATQAMLLSEGRAIDVGADAVIGARAIVRGQARIADAAVVPPCGHAGGQAGGEAGGETPRATEAIPGMQSFIGGTA